MPDPMQVAFKRIKEPKVGENGYSTVLSSILSTPTHTKPTGPLRT